MGKGVLTSAYIFGVLSIAVATFWSATRTTSARVHSQPAIGSLRVAIFPDHPSNVGGRNAAAMSEEGVRVVWKQIMEHLRRVDPDNAHLKRLLAIEVSVEAGPGTVSRAAGNKIVIGEGHLQAGTLLAYATARLSTSPNVGEAYNTWFDFMIDALVHDDAVVHLDEGYFAVQMALATRAPASDISTTFSETMFSWVALLLCHEAAHIALDHGARLAAAFPALPEDGSMWPEKAAVLSREMESEADRLGIELCVRARKFLPSAFSAWFQWQLARQVALTARPDLAMFAKTHPDASARFKSVVDELHRLGEVSEEGGTGLSAAFAAMSSKYEKAIRNGELDALFPMRHRPVEVSVSMERSIKRATELAIVLERQPGGSK